MKKQPMKWEKMCANHLSHLLVLYKMSKEDKEFNNGKNWIIQLKKMSKGSE